MIIVSLLLIYIWARMVSGFAGFFCFFLLFFGTIGAFLSLYAVMLVIHMFEEVWWNPSGQALAWWFGGWYAFGAILSLGAVLKVKADMPVIKEPFEWEGPKIDLRRDHSAR